MFKSSLWGKLLAVALVVLLIALVLARIGFMVDERRGWQQEAIRNVQQSQAGAQAVLGPWLHRACVEEWEQEVGEGKDRRVETQRREFRVQQAPRALTVAGQAAGEQRYRGLFKVNGFLTRLDLKARWDAPDALLAPRAETHGARLACGPVTLMLAVSDTRGVQRADLKVDGQPLAVNAGTEHPGHPRGMHAVLAPAAGAPVQAELSIDLRGTGRLALVPAAAQTEWDLRSDWPHPSFGGRFLPVQREVREDGFHAVWRVSALASSAARDVVEGAALCGADVSATAPDDYTAEATTAPGGKNCLDTLAVSFIDPVNPYVLADRAVKYGLLFVALTFIAVALTELLAPRVRRVHPVQYALVGLALSLFFMLLLALSEHMRFEMAYAAASLACAGVLGVYGSHMLGGWRAGALFAAALAGLYGLLYVLLTREQTALVVGTLGLFAAVAAVMLLTRRLDWYHLFDELAAPPRARTE